MTERALKYLSDISKAIELIEDFTKSVSDYNEFLHDLKTRSAVERQLGIIGEAVNKYGTLLPNQALTNARKIVGLGNRLIHAYDAIDASMIWAIIKNHIQPLKDEVKSLLES